MRIINFNIFSSILVMASTMVSTIPWVREQNLYVSGSKTPYNLCGKSTFNNDGDIGSAALHYECVHLRDLHKDNTTRGFYHGTIAINSATQNTAHPEVSSGWFKLYTVGNCTFSAKPTIQTDGDWYIGDQDIADIVSTIFTQIHPGDYWCREHG